MASGRQLCSLLGHKGRGVWRCVLHPNQDLLITAGADSSIKVWRLADWLPSHHPLAARASDAFALPGIPAPPAGHATAVARTAAKPATAARCTSFAAAATDSAALVNPGAENSSIDAEGRTLAAPITTAAAGQVAATADGGLQPTSTPPAEVPTDPPASSARDSKGEWVRCMKLADQTTLYLGTNQGCLYTTHLPTDIAHPSSQWQLLYSSPRSAAIISMQIAHLGRPRSSPSLAPAQRRRAQPAHESESHSECHSLVFGDIRGVVTCLKVSPLPTDAKGYSMEPTPGLQASVPASAHVPPPTPNAAQREPPQAATDSASSQTRPGRDPLHQAHKSEQQARTLPGCSEHLSWDAQDGKPILAVFTSSGLGPCHVFATSVTGRPMRWWLMPEHTSSSAPVAQHLSPVFPGQQVRLLAEVRAPAGRGSQIVALDACPKQGLLICGNMAGDVMGFAIPSGLMQARPSGVS